MAANSLKQGKLGSKSNKPTWLFHFDGGQTESPIGQKVYKFLGEKHLFY